MSIATADTFQPRDPTHKFNDGGSNRGSYFIPKKVATSEFAYPKISLLFLHVAYPKKSLSTCTFSQPQNIPLFFATPKNPCVFHRPKKSLLAKISGPQKITQTSLSLKYVSGAPGPSGICECLLQTCCRHIAKKSLTRNSFNVYLYNHVLCKNLNFDIVICSNVNGNLRASYGIIKIH